MPDISYSLIFYMWSGNSTRVQNKYSIMAIQSFDIWKSLHPLQLTVLKGSFTAYVRHKLLQRELKNGVEPSLKYNWQKRAAISWAGHFQRKENPSIWAVGFACKCQIHLLPVSLLLLKVSFKKVSAPFSSTSTVHKKKMQFCKPPHHHDSHIRYDKIMLLGRGKTVFVFNLFKPQT